MSKSLPKTIRSVSLTQSQSILLSQSQLSLLLKKKNLKKVLKEKSDIKNIKNILQSPLLSQNLLKKTQRTPINYSPSKYSHSLSK